MGIPFNLSKNPQSWIYLEKSEIEIMKKMVKALQENKSLSTSALAKLCGIKRNNISGVLRWLLVKKIIYVRQFKRNRIYYLSTKYKKKRG